MNVLIVDDTKNIRLLLTKCLEMEGYSVKTADDGKKALEMIVRERFDLAFIDVKMPVMSGTEVLRQMREMGVNTPVIIITAYATVKNAVDCTKLGAVAYLQKPFTTDKIKAVLSQLMSSPFYNCLFENMERVKVEIAAGDYKQALLILRHDVMEHPFDQSLYSQLAHVSLLLGNENDAEKYLKLRDALL